VLVLFQQANSYSAEIGEHPLPFTGIKVGGLDAHIDSALRTPHNLFHGDKHTPPSVEGRDEALVRAALAVLEAVLPLDNELHAHFDDWF
jgi:hypothetical protein